MVTFRIVDLGRDYPGKIENFAEARNSFLENLPDDEYILFIDSDEEASQMLLNYVEHLPFAGTPYYRIRRINLMNGIYREAWNPEYQPRLVSNKVRWFGRIHEGVKPTKPCMTIDFPIVHNSKADKEYPPLLWRWHFVSLPSYSKLFIIYAGLKKSIEMMQQELRQANEKSSANPVELQSSRGELEES